MSDNISSQYDTGKLEEVSTDLKELNTAVAAISSFAGSVGDIQFNDKTGFSTLIHGESSELGEEIKSKDTSDLIKRVRLYLKDYYKEIIIWSGYIILVIFNILFLGQFIKAAVTLDVDILQLDMWSFLFFFIGCIVLWVYSTSSVFFNFYMYKFGGLYLISFSLLIRVAAAIYYLFFYLFIPYIGRLKVTEFMTEKMIVGLGWVSTIVPTFIIFVFLVYKVFSGIKSELNVKAIETFKVTHYIDFTPHSKYDYDIMFVRDLRTGARIRIRQHDRWVHGCGIGATGTAKTSSVILPIVNQDLNTKARNVDAQKKALISFIKQGKAYISSPFDDINYGPALFNSLIHPVPGFEKEFEESVVNKYKSAGITVIAPDCSLTDNVYDLSVAKGFVCNRIDPMHERDGSLKPGSKGSNPLVISPRIPEWERRKEIVKRATFCADIMQIMFEMGGKSDPYFASVNRIGTITVAMVVMLCQKRLYKKQPKLTDIRDIINDFSMMKNYVTTLKEVNDENKGIYNPILQVVKNEFLGPGREKFEQHCQGLRIQFNNFFSHPDIERILCADDDDCVDMDSMLANGEVTVINIELGDLGPVDSPCFGLFLTISMINAVLRRPGTEWTRLPHFWTIDEFPLIINPKMESCFTLFRKFRTAMLVAMQTLDQMNKSPFLSYLKGVILNSCGYHVVFGRTNIDDQKTYSALGGIVDKVVEQKGYSHTPLTTDNPSFSMSSKFSVEQVARVNGEEIRERDFQEVTLFMVKKGRAIPPIAGRVDFLRKVDWLPIKRYKVDWNKVYQAQPYKPEFKDTVGNTQPIPGAQGTVGNTPDTLSTVKVSMGNQSSITDDSMGVVRIKGIDVPSKSFEEVAVTSQTPAANVDPLPRDKDYPQIVPEEAPNNTLESSSEDTVENLVVNTDINADEGPTVTVTGNTPLIFGNIRDMKLKDDNTESSTDFVPKKNTAAPRLYEINKDEL